MEHYINESTSKLYRELIKHFHPDVSPHPEAKKRTIIINKAKGNEAELYHLALIWGVPIPAGVKSLKGLLMNISHMTVSSRALIYI